MNTKDIGFELDDLSARMDMGIHNLAYIIEAAEERNMDETLASAFSCTLCFLSSIQKELDRNVEMMFEARKESKA